TKDKQPAHRQRHRRQRDRDSLRAIPLDSRTNEQRDSRARKTRERSGERKCARATLRRILLRQPQRVHRKIRSAKSQKEKAGEKPWQGRRAQVKNLSKSDRNEPEHQRKVKCQRAAPS